MRVLLERAPADRVLIDGVKFTDAAGWTLVVPDPDEATTHVTAEGDSTEAAQLRAEAMAAEIGGIIAGSPS